MKRNLTPILLVLTLIFAAPTFAEVGKIANGIDTWVTPADGSSYTDLSDSPIPAGFFCLDSKPFLGQIHWKGEQIASLPAGALGQADTIVQRLDDAVFDRAGRSTTRLQVRALALSSIQPIETSCGKFNVSAKLHGAQPITSMEIVRENDHSGYFTASLALNVRMTFTPVANKRAALASNSRSLVIDRPVQLQSERAAWATELPAVNQVGQIGGFILVDTDGDNATDTYLPGQSAFYTLGSAESGARPSACSSNTPGIFCHQDPTDGHCHCTTCQCIP